MGRLPGLIAEVIAHQVDVILTATEVGTLAARGPTRTILFAALECELLDRRRFKSQAEAEIAVVDFTEGWSSQYWPSVTVRA